MAFAGCKSCELCPSIKVPSGFSEIRTVLP